MEIDDATRKRNETLQPWLDEADRRPRLAGEALESDVDRVRRPPEDP